MTGADVTARIPRRRAGPGSGLTVISGQATAEPAPSGVSSVDRDAWTAFLEERLAPDWRPEEFDPETWLFTGDPDNPATTSTRCLVARCAAVVNSRTLCGGCERALASSDVTRVAFLATHRPVKPRSARLTGQTCVVARDGVGCERRRISNLSGLCNSHGSAWFRYRDGGGTLTLARWRDQHARPLPAVPACQVPGCAHDATAHDATAEVGAGAAGGDLGSGDLGGGDLDRRPGAGQGLCSAHRRAWRRSQSGRARARQIPPQQWARRWQRLGHGHQFSLAALSPVLRRELLYALQQRDGQGHKIDPVAMRALVTCLTDPDADPHPTGLGAGLGSLTERTYEQLVVGLPRNGAVRAYARILTRIVGLAFEQFRGVTHTDGDVWDCLALDLAAPRAGRRANLTTVDFTPIQQQWLRDAAKQWAHTVRPDGPKLARAVQACTLASHALGQRSGGGHRPGELSFADMTVVFDAFTRAARPDGQRYNSHFRRGLWARLHEVLDFGRATGELAELAATFHRRSTQSIRSDEVNEDELGKAVPETVIAQLDAHLDLWQHGHRHGRSWTERDSAALFATAYQVLRDTGRRPGELVTLSADCLEIDGDQYALVYDNHKQRRLRRRLPITTDTARIIERWQDHRGQLDLPDSNRRWLFPAPHASAGPGHLTTIRLATALRRWVAAIPALHSDLPGPDGAPLPFDRALIYPYAFRHSYAQRHADAGVGVEVLKELMDHRDLSVTQGYYKVGLTRKRQAIAIMSRYVHDRTGHRCSGPGLATSTTTTTSTTTGTANGSVTSYELRSVAVPFGNCIEPSNVKAGGKGCPIRFQCAGCGFYRPDPSYLPAIEEHINALRADRETALALDADGFVTRNLADQADAFGHVAAAMRDRLAALPDDERAEAQQASTVLRKLRAGQRTGLTRTLLPLTVKDQP
ncbi:tyrosine-type recombinase/integrase [Pseudonocardia sichuanensis]|nr:site-specific integrase [Pseudonocardia kunmingensis]